MRPFSIIKTTLFLSALSFMSCTKEELPSSTIPARTIRFVLFTEEDFSGDNDNITFSLVIRNNSKTLFDSSLSIMKVKDIPTAANKLIFEKQVPDDDGSALTAGFYYTIENVGLSWYLDTCSAGQTLKVINYSFK